MDIFSELKEYGVNIEEAIHRFMNNDELYKKMLLKLPDNIESLPILKFVETGDYSKAVANAHTLKGVTGNLSLTPLYKAYSRIVDLFREGKPEEAKGVLEDVLPIQDDIIGCIKKYS